MTIIYLTCSHMFCIFVIRFVFVVHASPFKWVWQLVHQILRDQKRLGNRLFLNTTIANVVIMTKSVNMNLPIAPWALFIWQEQLRSWVELSRIPAVYNLVSLVSVESLIDTKILGLFFLFCKVLIKQSNVRSKTSYRHCIFFIRPKLPRNFKKNLFPVDYMCRLHPQVAFAKLTNWNIFNV